MVEEKDIVYSFSFPEFERYDRGVRWYIIMGIIVASVILYAVLTANYLFAVVIVLAAAVMALRDFRAPATIVLQMTDEGLYYNEDLVPYRDLHSFWIVYDPPVFKNLHIKFQGLRAELLIPLADLDPVPVRQFLRGKVTEDLEKREESIIDMFSKILKF
jgi:hypothetical protein